MLIVFEMIFDEFILRVNLKSARFTLFGLTTSVILALCLLNSMVLAEPGLKFSLGGSKEVSVGLGSIATKGNAHIDINLYRNSNNQNDNANNDKTNNDGTNNNSNSNSSNNLPVNPSGQGSGNGGHGGDGGNGGNGGSGPNAGNGGKGGDGGNAG